MMHCRCGWCGPYWLATAILPSIVILIVVLWSARRREREDRHG